MHYSFLPFDTKRGQMNDFERSIAAVGEPELRSAAISVFQVNLGLRCNLACLHCHVSASPKRKEEMDWETMQLVMAAARRTQCSSFDLTGGAPELHPHFRRFVRALRVENAKVMVRTNLTALLEPGLETMPEFLRDQRVALVASLPCYLEENVDRQRGAHAHAGSITALRRLNELGYAVDPELPLDLVYNPAGPSLPPEHSGLEAAYRRELGERYGLRFSRLLTITNMPIGRFRQRLQAQGEMDAYVDLLKSSINTRTLAGLMCRHQVSVSWEGTLFDCDFNLALGMSVDHGAPNHIRDFDPSVHARRRVVTGDHCFGCTAGCGSSCGGSLV